MTGALSLVVRLRVRGGAAAAFLSAARANAEASLREPGCRRFEVVQSQDDEHAFTLCELYDDRDAFDAHRATAHFRRWRETVAAFVVEQINEFGTVLGPAAPGGAAGAVVLRAAEAPVVDRGGGVSTTYLATADVGAARFMTGTTDFAPGASVALHSHDCEESVVVLAGLGRFDCEGRAEELAPGDATWVPAGAPHRFVNVGQERLRILWTYGRTDPTRTFTADGSVVPIVPPRR